MKKIIGNCMKCGKYGIVKERQEQETKIFLCKKCLKNFC